MDNSEGISHSFSDPRDFLPAGAGLLRASSQTDARLLVPASLSTLLFPSLRRSSSSSRSWGCSLAHAAQGRLFGQIKDITGPEAAAATQAIVDPVHRARGSGIVAALSLMLLVVGASATFSSLKTALDFVFKVKSPEGFSGLAVLLCARY